MTWALLGQALRLAFLLRVPLVTLALLAASGPLARHSALLDNLFDAGREPSDAGVVCFAAFVLAFTAIAMLNLTLHYGSDRLEDHRTVRMSQRRPLLTFVLGTLAAAIFAASVVRRTENEPWVTALWAAGGAVAAFALVVVAKVVQLALTDPATTPHPPPFLVFPAYRVPWVGRRFDRLYCWSTPVARRFKATFNSWSQWPLGILRPAGQGYLVDVAAPPGTLKLRSGHAFALSLSLIAFVVYLVIGLSKRHITADAVFVPALAYLLLFCVVGCSFLSALTFFFDRYRFPLFAVIAALALVTAQAPKSDHFFRVKEKDLSRLPVLTPTEYVHGRAKTAKHRRLILVATPGGGIQAAAWTAEVLAKLEERRPADDAFRNAVALISSVSGGSLGSMIYAATFSGQVPRRDVIHNARVSAINEVAWGWTFADFWRAVAPWFGDRTIDRGRALEDKWAAVNHLGEDGGDTLLSDWAAEGVRMPAVIFNAMLLEVGRHVIFSSTAFPRDLTRGIRNFYDLYPEHKHRYDVRVTTAARLSASFPYVAPASRSNVESLHAGDYHFVDGGYYDNFGVDALIGWLGEALGGPSANGAIEDVLILTIQHFAAGDPSDTRVRGWGFQLYAPLAGLLSMWNAAPAQRDANEFRLFAERTRAHGGPRIWIASIAYTGGDSCKRAPLSWKLSESQQACIDEAWRGVVARQSPELSCIDRYLDGGDVPECQYPSKGLR